MPPRFFLRLKAPSRMALLTIGMSLLGVAGLVVAGRVRAAAPDYTAVPVDPKELRLYWHDDEGRPYKTFRRLDAWLRTRGERLAFAMNAGMYHADFAPVGLLVSDGHELAPLNRGEGVGNFFLKPNGVFFVDAKGAHVVESDEFPVAAKDVRLATQSGPLLLRHGVIHPRFDPASRSRNVRNGVGICKGRPVFAISRRRVTLHEFAVYFRDTLHCDSALYLDGAVSSLHSSDLHRSDARAALGPILAVVVPKQDPR
jgi:uncharacterized protein YigE (DUF2233 family)